MHRPSAPVMRVNSGRLLCRSFVRLGHTRKSPFKQLGGPSTACEVKVANVAARQRDCGVCRCKPMHEGQGCRVPRFEVLLNEAISCGQSSGNWWQALNLLCGWRRQGRKDGSLDQTFVHTCVLCYHCTRVCERRNVFSLLVGQ